MKSKYWLWSGMLLGAVGASGCGSDVTDGEEKGECTCEIIPPDETRFTPVDWDEETSLGVSARDAFAGYSGECTRPLTWDSSAFEGTVTPEGGTTEMTVKVTVDESSASVRDCRSSSSNCSPLMQADAHVTLTSEDGVFVDEGDVTVSYFPPGSSPMASYLMVPYEGLGGSLSIALEPKSEATLQYTIFPGDCSGSISLTVSTANESGHGGSGAGGPLGHW